jgi:flagellar biosynthesis/type III secretory pathway protein FliH
MSEKENETETVKTVLKELLKDMPKHKITISSPEINAAFQDGWREGFIAGVTEGMSAMSYVHEQMTAILQSALTQAADTLENLANDQTQTSKPPEKNHGIYQ